MTNATGIVPEQLFDFRCTYGNLFCLCWRSSQVVNIANDQRTLKEIENKILYMLANASGKTLCSTSYFPNNLMYPFV